MNYGENEQHILAIFPVPRYSQGCRTFYRFWRVRKHRPPVHGFILAVVLLSLLATLALRWSRPDIFTWNATIPSTVTYFFIMAAQIRLVFIRKENKKTWSTFGSGKITVQHRPPAPLRPPLLVRQPILEEYLFYIIILVISTCNGALAGVIWWTFGGYEVHSIINAVEIGSILGFLVAALILSGGTI